MTLWAWRQGSCRSLFGLLLPNSSYLGCGVQADILEPSAMAILRRMGQGTKGDGTVPILSDERSLGAKLGSCQATCRLLHLEFWAQSLVMINHIVVATLPSHDSG